MDTQFELILSQYESQLQIPEHKTLTPFLLCPVGLIGAGKTTVMKPLSEGLGLVRISNDEIRELLLEEKIDHEQEDVHKIAYFLIKKYLEAGYGIGIDANCSSKKDLLGKLGQQYGVPLVWIHISPPEEFILTKLRNYNHGKLFKDADEAIENYMRSKTERAELDKVIPYMYTFDTSREDIPYQIAEATKVIKSGILTI